MAKGAESRRFPPAAQHRSGAYIRLNLNILLKVRRLWNS
jgi:hypothetical protein